MNTKTLSIFTAALLALPLTARTDEQNGLSVNATRKTLERGTKRGDGDKRKSFQQQVLKIDIKNNRLKSLPTGELKWTVLVKRRHDGYEKLTGTKQLPALMHGKNFEVTSDTFEFRTYREDEKVSKESTEFEIVINHDGQQTYRYATTSEFANLAKKARESDDHEDKDDEHKDEPKVAENDPKKMPDAPIADGTKPAEQSPASSNAVVPERKVNLSPVDFFNLGGK
jgi:hypothetical protein